MRSLMQYGQPALEYIVGVWLVVDIVFLRMIRVNSGGSLGLRRTRISFACLRYLASC